MDNQPQNADNFLARLWNWMGRHPLLTITFFLAAQTVPSLWSGELWYPDEVRHASILQNLLHSDQWVLLQMHGAPYVDKPPVYFWFQAALARIFGTDRPPIFFLSVALSGLFFLFSTYALARRIGGMKKEGGLLCALLLLTNYFFVERCHAPRMDLMFGGFMNFSAVCLFIAWSRPGFQFLTVAGFALAALATLTKGPLGLIFPVLAGVAWLAWQKRARRLWNWDVALGFAVALLMIGAWIGGCIEIAGVDLMRQMFKEQILHRAVNSPMLNEPFYYYALSLAVVWLPWTVLIFFLPLRPLFRRGHWVELWSRRKDAGAGPVFLWCMVLGVFLVLTCMSYKLTLYMLYLFAPLIVLTGRALEGMNPAARRRLTVTLAGLLIFVALAVPWIKLIYPPPQSLRLQGLVPVAVCAGLLALVLFRLKTRPAGQIILAIAVGMTMAGQPLYLITRPGQDVVMSPKAVCAEVRQYIEQGYSPVTYRMYHYRAGTLDYYVGHDLPDTDKEEEFLGQLASHPKVVMMTTGWFWGQWTNRPPSLKMVSHHLFGWGSWVVAVQDGTAAPPK